MTVPTAHRPVVALTGTPGTGKTTIAGQLRAHGDAVLPLADFAGDARFAGDPDPTHHDATIIDEHALGDHLRVHLDDELAARGQPADGARFIESHFAHELDIADRIIVLRCSPTVLVARLQGRDWPEEKIRQNVEAEAIDLITQESIVARDRASETGRIVHVGEVDTTHQDPETCAARVHALSVGPPEDLMIGTVDWSDEVLEWF